MTLACPACARCAGVVALAPLFDLQPWWPLRWRVQVGALVRCAGCGETFGYRRGQTFAQPFGRNAETPATPEAPKREPSRVPSGGDEDMPFNRRRR